jgi:hypothetical protein
MINIVVPVTATDLAALQAGNSLTLTLTPAVTPVLTYPTSLTFTDTAGNVWGITTKQQVSANGITDTSTANVTVLTYVNGLIFQQNTAGNWYSESSPKGPWVLTVNPLNVIELESGTGSLALET